VAWKDVSNFAESKVMRLECGKRKHERERERERERGRKGRKRR